MSMKRNLVVSANGIVSVRYANDNCWRPSLAHCHRRCTHAFTPFLVKGDENNSSRNNHAITNSFLGGNIEGLGTRGCFCNEIFVGCCRHFSLIFGPKMNAQQMSPQSDPFLPIKMCFMALVRSLIAVVRLNEAPSVRSK